MSQNPEEGRFTKESKVDALREARRITAQMKRQFRAVKQKKAASKKARQWLANHKKKHDEARDDMHTVSYGRAPLNRRGRRHFAKLVNAYKTPHGWQQFNDNYRATYGYMESVSRGARARKDAAKAKKLGLTETSITAAIAKGDK